MAQAAAARQPRSVRAAQILFAHTRQCSVAKWHAIRICAATANRDLFNRIYPRGVLYSSQIRFILLYTALRFAATTALPQQTIVCLCPTQHNALPSPPTTIRSHFKPPRFVRVRPSSPQPPSRIMTPSATIKALVLLPSTFIIPFRTTPSNPFREAGAHHNILFQSCLPTP